MAAQLEQLTLERDAAKNELDMAKDTARIYYQRMLQAEAERSQLQTMDSDRFLLVLIDGDSMPFLDEFVSRGMEGGEDAGKHLRNAILHYSKSNPAYRADDRIFIWIYANARGLSRTYKAAKIIPDETVFEHFMTGFNRSHQFSDFIDAGPHKEAADSKIKAYFEFFYRNQHCQHVMLGASADNSYAGFLRPLSLPDSKVNDRITMIEGPPFAADLRKVAQGFRQAPFKTIFRSSKIEVVPNGTHVITAGVKRPASEALMSLRERQTSKADAAVVTRPRSADSNSTHPKAASNPSLAPFPFIFQNQYGQRLDAPLSIDKDYLKQLYNGHARLCNNFYLKGYCPYGSGCEWDHSQKLSQIQLDTFRQKARTSNCRNPFCVDPACCLGHMCQRESCNISQCKFLPEMHNIDVSKVYQYNTETGEKKELKPS